VSYTFSSAGPKQLGYQKEQVDTFIELARAQYADTALELITSNQIRNTEFELIPSGYEITAVDTAMDRLEDAFAAREISRQKTLKGDFAVEDRLIRIREIVQGRVSRPKKRKFSSTGFLLRGYSRSQVDNLCKSIEAHLNEGQPIQLNTVRRAIFTAKRGGYLESQVDAFLDRVVEILQIEKNK
jgi:DivIVA domain-containing protein